MEALALPNFQADLLIQALCRTLVHSLWQGVILAAVAGLIILCTRKQKANTRYHLLVGSLVFFIMGTIITFGLEMRFAQRPTATTEAIALVNIAPAAAIAGSPVQAYTATPSITQELFNYLNTHASQVVMIWFLLICIKSIRMLTGLYDVHLLRTQHTMEPDQRWSDRVKTLAAQLRISRTVSLLESAIAKAPMVVGHLKPLILVPAGLLTSLTPEAIEAILIHELAHIRRRDYLVNLLQCFVEIIFFFNPAVTWISSLIKAERENCCDDMVMVHTRSKTVYIQALVSCQEYHTPAYAMGLPGSRNTLLARVKRMVNDHNHSLNLVEKTLLSLCLVGAGIFMVAFSGRTKAASKPEKVITVKTTTTTTTTRSSDDPLSKFPTDSLQPILFTHSNANNLQNGTPLQPLELYRDTAPGLSIILDTLQTFRDTLRAHVQSTSPLKVSTAPLVDPLDPLCITPRIGALSVPLAMNVSVPVTATQATPAQVAEKAKLDEAVRANKAIEAKQATKAQVAEKAKFDAAVRANKADEAKQAAQAQVAEKARAAAQARSAADAKKAAAVSMPLPNATPAPNAAPSPMPAPAPAPPAGPGPAPVGPTAPAPLSAVGSYNKTYLPYKNTYSANASSYIASPSTFVPAPGTHPREQIHLKTPENISATEGEDLTKRVNADLLKSGIITANGDLSYKLNRKEFIVNGKPMPANITKAYADKYVPSDGWSLVYNWQTDEPLK